VALTHAIRLLKQRGSAVVVVSHRASALEVLDTTAQRIANARQLVSSEHDENDEEDDD